METECLFFPLSEYKKLHIDVQYPLAKSRSNKLATNYAFAWRISPMENVVKPSHTIITPFVVIFSLGLSTQGEGVTLSTPPHESY